MKSIRLTLLLIMSNIILANAQIQLIEDNCTTFDNRSVQVFIIEGEYCVLNIDTSLISESQLADTLTLEKIVKRTHDKENQRLVPK